MATEIQGKGLEQLPAAVLKNTTKMLVENERSERTILKELKEFVLQGFSGGGTSFIVDSQLDTESHNAIANAAVATRFKQLEAYLPSEGGIKTLTGDDCTVKGSAVLRDGNIIDSVHFNRTDYVDIEGAKRIVINKGSQAVYCVFNANKEPLNGLLVKSPTDNIEVDLSKVPKYIIVNHRLELGELKVNIYYSEKGGIESSIIRHKEEWLSDILDRIEQNIFKGKVCSVLADSIGVFPYSQDPTMTEQDMWWSLIMQRFEMRKDVVSAVGGTAITNHGTNAEQSFTERVKKLNLSNSDFLIIEGGMNDLGQNGIQLGEFNYKTALSEQNQTQFIPAYRSMIEYLQTTYHNMHIWICTIPMRSIGKGSGQTFPWKNSSSGNDWIQYNEAIRHLAKDYGLGLIDLAASGITWYNSDIFTKDGVHPLKDGHKMMAERAFIDMSN